MLLVSLFSFFSTDFADGIFNLTRFKVLATSLVTFVSACTDTAVWTDAFHIPVREKHLTMGAVTLAYCFLIDMTTVNE